MSILTLAGVAAGYGGGTAITDITLTVEAGAIHTVLGPNGAGKTTLLHTIVGLVPTVVGTVHVGDRDVTRLPTHRRARLGVGLVPQGGRLFGQLTVVEHLTLAAGRGGGARIGELFLHLPALANRLDHRPDQLSGGEAAMLAVARAVLRRPRLLLLDEPADGLAPAITATLNTLISRAAADGAAVLMTASRRSDIHPDADQVTHLRHGRTTTRTPVDNINPPNAGARCHDMTQSRHWADLLNPER